METVLFDKFSVPEEAKAKFLEEVHRSAALLGTLPGFVEGYVYERTDGESPPQHHDVGGSGKTRRHFRTPGRTQRRHSRRSVSTPAEIMKT